MALPAGVSMGEMEWDDPPPVKRFTKEQVARYREAKRVAKFLSKEAARLERKKAKIARGVAKRLNVPLPQAAWIVSEYFMNWNLANQLADREAQRLKRGRK